MRAMVRAILLVGLSVSACVSEPELDGRACSDVAPCPEPYVCAPDGTCHAPCTSDEGCVGELRCMSGLCLAVTGDRTCTRQEDCAAGELCRSGLCEPEGGAECADPEDCTTPGLCQAADGALCTDGRCSYPPLTCDQSPAAECAGNDDLFRTYGAGGCQAATGECGYAVTEVACPNCQQTCLQPCEGISCPDEAGGCRVNGRCEPGEPGSAAACLHDDAPDGTACRRPDGGEGTCTSGACRACLAAADCDDGNPCTVDACDPQTGACSHQSVSGSCDDGNACTTGDSCMGGLCRGSSTVSCDSPPGECFEAAGACNPATGGCEYTAKTLGTPCSSDNQSCTTDQCDGNGACVHPAAPVGTRCDDGELCTYADACDASGRCRGTTLVCNDAPGVCGAARSCAGTAMCAESFPGGATSCDDGNACTHSDGCNGAGGCQGTSYSCNDGDSCTQDACDGAGGCSHTPLAPSGLAPTGGASVARQDVIMVWGACSSATQYELEIQYEGASGNWRPYFTFTESTNLKTVWPCSSQAPNAPCNSNFRFRVRARSGGVWGPHSSWATFFWANCRAC